MSETTNKQKKVYKTILADPPWDIQQTGNFGAINHYSLMSLEQIKAMPVADLAAPDSHCWLWVTNAVLRYGYDVLEAWGFTPRSIFVWLKPYLGPGVYLRNSTESVLLGTRGKAPIQFNSQMNWGFFPRREHSHKPEELYDIIERCSPGPERLELFARRRRHGWDAWGNEIDSDVEIAGYPVPTYSPKVIGEGGDRE